MRYPFFRNFDVYHGFQPKTTFFYYFEHDYYSVQKKWDKFSVPSLEEKRLMVNKLSILTD